MSGNCNYQAAKFIERIQATTGVIEENPITEALEVFNSAIVKMGYLPDDEDSAFGSLFDDGSFCIVSVEGILSIEAPYVLSFLVDEGKRAIKTNLGKSD